MKTLTIYITAQTHTLIYPHDTFTSMDNDECRWQSKLWPSHSRIMIKKYLRETNIPCCLNLIYEQGLQLFLPLVLLWNGVTIVMITFVDTSLEGLVGINISWHKCNYSRLSRSKDLIIDVKLYLSLGIWDKLSAFNGNGCPLLCL